MEPIIRFEREPYDAGGRERALLVGVDQQGAEWPMDESLAELGRLAETDGATVVGVETQRLKRSVSRTFIGSGKAREIAERVHAESIDVVIFDGELTPSQQANLESVMGEGVKVIDRTALILDIFGRHAKTREGRLQVQLAQSMYLLPRLRGMWGHLVREQTRGGIGSRFGQGESQLEVDRRLVRKRIASLQRELEVLERRRGVQSKGRWDAGVFRVALVGYTNAGKSTLLNTLTAADVYAHDELFATLDPTTRSMDLSEGRKITVTDTVGFIQKLPTMLVEAFKSTLAEVRAANLILLVVDVSDSNNRREIDAVNKVLEEIGAADIDRVLVFNKCDLLTKEELHQRCAIYDDAVFISAKTGMGLSGLTHRIAQEASKGDVTISVCIPYDKGKYVRMIHERCQVLRERYEQEGLIATIKADEQMANLLNRYVVEDEGRG